MAIFPKSIDESDDMSIESAIDILKNFVEASQKPLSEALIDMGLLCPNCGTSGDSIWKCLEVNDGKLQ